MLQIWPVRTFADNYVWVLEPEGSGKVAVVDPGEAGPVVAALDERGLEVTAILVTHHHGDHVGGVTELIRRFHPPVFGPADEAIAGVDHPVGDGQAIELPGLELALDIVSLPGHTAGHIGYVGPSFAFVGDTLFAGGCGRVFEGTFVQMHDSLSRLAALVPETKAYCSHEYTLANLRFAREVEPNNAELADRLESAKASRADNQPTVPSTIGCELATNPFLRCSQPTVIEAAEARAGHSLETAAEVFGVLRTWKDGWSG